MDKSKTITRTRSSCVLSKQRMNVFRTDQSNAYYQRHRRCYGCRCHQSHRAITMGEMFIAFVLVDKKTGKRKRIEFNELPEWLITRFQHATHNTLPVYLSRGSYSLINFGNANTATGAAFVSSGCIRLALADCTNVICTENVKEMEIVHHTSLSEWMTLQIVAHSRSSITAMPMHWKVEMFLWAREARTSYAQNAFTCQSFASEMKCKSNVKRIEIETRMCLNS